MWNELAKDPTTVEPPDGDTTPKAARNGRRRRAELADELAAVRLPLGARAGGLRPVIVVTRNKSPEALVTAGAWRVLSRLAAQDEWYVVTPEIRREAGAEGSLHQEGCEQKTVKDRICGWVQRQVASLPPIADVSPGRDQPNPKRRLRKPDKGPQQHGK